MSSKVVLAWIFCSILMPSVALGENGINGFVDLNYYPYVQERSDSSITINALANLSEDFQYFSLSNFSTKGERSDIGELDTVYSEQNLRWALPIDGFSKILQMTVQSVLRSGDSNDLLRGGLRWATHETPLIKSLMSELNLQYWINFHLAQFDRQSGRQWQIEHAFRSDVLPNVFNDRVYLSGFADHNINNADGTDHTWVIETQLGVRLIGSFYAVFEKRYSGYRLVNEHSFGAGLEYLIGF